MALSPDHLVVTSDSRQISSHGTILYPVACYENNLTQKSFIAHWHDELEFLTVCEGCAQIMAGSANHALNAGEGVFLNAGCLHAAHNAGAAKCVLHSIAFHPSLIGGYPNSIYWKRYIQPVLSSKHRECVFHGDASWKQDCLHDADEAWNAHVQETENFELQVREKLSHLLATMLAHQIEPQAPRSPKAIRSEERTKEMLQYIYNHYDEPITLEILAKKSSISVSECLRCFHDTIGTTPIQFIRQFRLQKAAELLATTSLSIIEIGMKCGFEEMSYFAKIFRNVYGKTPSDYRKSFL